MVSILFCFNQTFKTLITGAPPVLNLHWMEHIPYSAIIYSEIPFYVLRHLFWNIAKAVQINCTTLHVFDSWTKVY